MSPYPYEAQGVTKTVSKTKVKEQEGFKYTLSQYIPNNYYGSLINFSEIYNSLYGDTHYTNVELSDTLNSNLAINGNITITNEKGQDRTSYFDINVTGNSVKAVVKKNILDEVDFYSHVYNLNIPVYIKSGTGSKLTNTSVIPNQGKSSIKLENDTTNYDSNTVETSLYYNVNTSITNGTITGSSTVDIHNNKTITFTPNDGYYISSVTINGEEQDISSYNGGGTINFSNITKDYNIVVKTEAYGYTQITKRDSNTLNTVPRAIIRLYYDSECTRAVEGAENLITNAQGTITSPRMKKGTYYAKEIQAPWGYILNDTVQRVIINPGQTTQVVVENTQVRGQINFKKNDGEVNYKNTSYDESFAQGDASIQGAVYGLYAKENITSPDDGSVIYNAGQQIDIKTTDNNGKITWENLYLGKYYVQEITPSVGYLNDETQHEIDLATYYTDNYFSKGEQKTRKYCI